MSASLYVRFVLLALLLTLIAGCGYRLTSSQPGRIGTAQTIWIPFFSNESVSSTAQTVLRRTFYEESHALRGLNPAENEASADLAMRSRILSYSSGVVSYSAIDQARELRLYLNVELEIVKKGQTEPLWKGQIQGTKQYQANNSLELQRNAEEQALDAAARIIAQKFYSALEGAAKP